MVAVSASNPSFSKCQCPAKILAKVIYIEDVLSSVPGTQFQWGHTHTHIQSYLPICDKCMELSLVISHFDSFFYKGFFTALDHPGDDSQRERAGAVTRSTSETGGGRDDICPGRVCAGAEWCTDLV